VYWFWDGDGTLLFKVEDIYLVNNDCKKDYVWEFVKQEDYEEVLNDSNYYNLETLWK
jgi:hypothetical protein